MSSIIESRGFDRLVDRIRDNDSKLKVVDLDGAGIGYVDVTRLAGALRGNTFVTEMRLANNKHIGNVIGSVGAGALAKMLPRNPTRLIKLDLSFNKIGDGGARTLAKVLPTNSTLTTLCLKGNNISAKGAGALAEGIPRNSTLTNLNLERNNIGDCGATSLAAVIPRNYTLTMLCLSENNISSKGARALAESLRCNFTLTYLFLDGNSFGDDGARALIRALLNNFSIHQFFLEVVSALERKVVQLIWINRTAADPPEATGLKIEWLLNLNEASARLVGLGGIRAAQEAAVSLALEHLEYFTKADQRRMLFQRLLGSAGRISEVAASVETVPRGRLLYWYAADCGAAPDVLINLLRAHPSLMTCKDKRHRLYPFALLATMPDADEGEATSVSALMETLRLDPSLIKGGIPGDDWANRTMKHPVKA